MLLPHCERHSHRPNQRSPLCVLLCDSRLPLLLRLLSNNGEALSSYSIGSALPYKHYSLLKLHKHLSQPGKQARYNAFQKMKKFVLTWGSIWRSRLASHSFSRMILSLDCKLAMATATLPKWPTTPLPASPLNRSMAESYVSHFFSIPKCILFHSVILS